jgi:hypothetical protein
MVLDPINNRGASLLLNIGWQRRLQSMQIGYNSVVCSHKNNLFFRAEMGCLAILFFAWREKNQITKPILI